MCSSDLIGHGELCELRNTIAVAYLVIKQGREIKESVGCHYNADYPKQ